MKHLQTLIPVMTSVLSGDNHADPLFSALVREGMRFHGYDDEGDPLFGSSQTSVTCQEFFDAKTRHPTPSWNGERRKLLDAGDEALLAYVADQVGAMQPPRGPFERLYVKTATAGRVYLAYAALEWYTGTPRTEMEQAIAAGSVYRPLSRWELAWGAYARMEKRWWMDSFRVVVPRLEVPVPVHAA